MIIPISDQYRIEGTRYAWEVQKARTRKHRKTGQPQAAWEPIQWYSTLPAALEGLADLRLRLANAQTVTEATQAAKDIAASLGKALAALSHPANSNLRDRPSQIDG